MSRSAPLRTALIVAGALLTAVLAGCATGVTGIAGPTTAATPTATPIAVPGSGSPGLPATVDPVAAHWTRLTDPDSGVTMQLPDTAKRYTVSSGTQYRGATTTGGNVVTTITPIPAGSQGSAAAAVQAVLAQTGGTLVNLENVRVDGHDGQDARITTPATSPVGTGILWVRAVATSRYVVNILAFEKGADEALATRTKAQAFGGLQVP
ncbi:hypothetical protein [Pseudonocardia sp. GCM10023141]|uniref:hypothetical protein n=1 Tax=Pseudonocardia sp. GCM10023141 TaxID=3252653 RepID=UPI00360E3AF8